MRIPVKQIVSQFRKKYSILTPTLEKLKDIARLLGYTVVEFNAIYNDEDVAVLIDQLKLDDLVSTSKGFTYASDSCRLIFVHEDLSQDEKTSVLLHEIGHIYCGHIEEKNIIGRDVVQENEANEFAHYMKNPNLFVRFGFFVRGHKALVAIGSLLVVVVVALCCIFFGAEKEYEQYYITQTGTKYHLEDCIHIKNKEDVKQITKQQYESGEYSPCGVCLP